MDIEVQNCVKLFIKANVRRVQIALALAVIKSKPEGITAVQHATNIQARFRLKYSNCLPEWSGRQNHSVIYDHKMLVLQQEQLMSSLWGALPQLPGNSVHSGPRNLHMCQGYSNDMFESEDGVMETNVQIDANCDDLLVEQNEMNLQFIHAMVQLKSVVNACTYVPAPELQKILSAVHSANNRQISDFHTESEPVVMEITGSQQPTAISGFLQSGMGFGFGTNPGATVSSGILKYIIHSSDANRLLVHSVEAVLQYLGQSILTDKRESLDSIVKNWKDSVLEYSLNVVLELVNHFAHQGEEKNECREVCFNFIRNTVDGILNTDSLNMHPIWTQQCCIIVELGNSKLICIDFLNYLIDKIQIISRNLKPKVSSANNTANKHPSDQKSGDVEKTFYIFYMAEKLLKKWKKLHLSNTLLNKNDTSSQGHSTNVMDLWRQNWCRPKSNTEAAMPSNHGGNNEENPVSKWKDVLEELVTNFTEDYPFYTLYSFKCLEILQLDD